MPPGHADSQNIPISRFEEIAQAYESNGSGDDTRDGGGPWRYGAAPVGRSDNLDVSSGAAQKPRYSRALNYEFHEQHHWKASAVQPQRQQPRPQSLARAPLDLPPSLRPGLANSARTPHASPSSPDMRRGADVASSTSRAPPPSRPYNAFIDPSAANPSSAPPGQPSRRDPSVELHRHAIGEEPYRHVDHGAGRAYAPPRQSAYPSYGEEQDEDRGAFRESAFAHGHAGPGGAAQNGLVRRLSSLRRRGRGGGGGAEDFELRDSQNHHTAGLGSSKEADTRRHWSGHIRRRSRDVVSPEQGATDYAREPSRKAPLRRSSGHLDALKAEAPAGVAERRSFDVLRAGGSPRQSGGSVGYVPGRATLTSRHGQENVEPAELYPSMELGSLPMDRQGSSPKKKGKRLFGALFAAGEKDKRSSRPGAHDPPLTSDDVAFSDDRKGGGGHGGMTFHDEERLRWMDVENDHRVLEQQVATDEAFATKSPASFQPHLLRDVDTTAREDQYGTRASYEAFHAFQNPGRSHASAGNPANAGGAPRTNWLGLGPKKGREKASKVPEADIEAMVHTACDDPGIWTSPNPIIPLLELLSHDAASHVGSAVPTGVTKTLARDIRREIKNADAPLARRKAALRLLTVLLVHSDSEAWRMTCLGGKKEMLGSLEELVSGTKTPISLKGMILDALSMLAHQHQDAGNDLNQVTKCFNKIRPSDRPLNGTPMDRSHPLFRLAPPEVIPPQIDSAPPRDSSNAGTESGGSSQRSRFSGPALFEAYQAARASSQPGHGPMTERWEEQGGTEPGRNLAPEVTRDWDTGASRIRDSQPRSLLSGVAHGSNEFQSHPRRRLDEQQQQIQQLEEGRQQMPRDHQRTGDARPDNPYASHPQDAALDDAERRTRALYTECSDAQSKANALFESLARYGAMGEVTQLNAAEVESALDSLLTHISWASAEVDHARSKRRQQNGQGGSGEYTKEEQDMAMPEELRLEAILEAHATLTHAREQWLIARARSADREGMRPQGLNTGGPQDPHEAFPAHQMPANATQGVASSAAPSASPSDGRNAAVTVAPSTGLESAPSQGNVQSQGQRRPLPQPVHWEEEPKVEAATAPQLPMPSLSPIDGFATRGIAHGAYFDSLPNGSSAIEGREGQSGHGPATPSLAAPSTTRTRGPLPPSPSQSSLDVGLTAPPLPGRSMVGVGLETSNQGAAPALPPNGTRTEEPQRIVDSDDESVIITPVQPSAKALGKRRQVSDRGEAFEAALATGATAAPGGAETAGANVAQLAADVQQGLHVADVQRPQSLLPRQVPPRLPPPPPSPSSFGGAPHGSAPTTAPPPSAASAAARDAPASRNSASHDASRPWQAADAARGDGPTQAPPIPPKRSVPRA